VFEFLWGNDGETEADDPSTLAVMFMQLLEIIIFAVVNMQSLNDIVKRLFIKIEIDVRVFHDRSTRMLQSKIEDRRSREASSDRSTIRIARQLGTSPPGELTRSHDAARSQIAA
jgi:hypothetical protein